ncbi:MAG: hypothetical protein K6B28_10140, partial [Lachnospiraceae bacterium]|nr:hypothetical protein [Lachnospiraceae bacterium]
MISVILIWCIVFFITSGIGYATLSGLGRLYGDAFKINLIKSLVCGLCVVNVYAEAYSLIDGVGLTAFLIIFVISLILLVILKKGYLDILKDFFYSVG